MVGLDYKNPWLSPFEEMQRWKTHPAIRAHLEGGKRLGYGARAINDGGLLSLPKTVFPGGALVGCDAGYLNAARIKGSHAAIKTGMLCAEAAFDGRHRRPPARRARRPTREAFEKSWLHDELDSARNFKPWFKKGLLRRHADDRHRAVAAAQARHQGAAVDAAPHAARPRAACSRPTECTPIAYPKPDGKLTFDRLSLACSSATPTTRRTSRRT